MAKDKKFTRRYIKEADNANLYALYTYPDDEHLVYCGTSTELQELGLFHFYSSMSRGCGSVIVNGKRYIVHKWKLKDLDKLEVIDNGN